MKLVTILLTAALMHAYASGSAQHVTLSGTGLTLKQVFAAVEKQTGYVVFNKKGELDDSQTISLAVTAMPLRDLLDLVLKDQHFVYDIHDKTIVLSRMNVIAYTGISAPPISGRVFRPDGQPLAGATVRIKGSAKGVVTDAKGLFSLEAGADDILMISYTGYAEKHITVGSESSFSIILAVNDSPLDEVQVIAYGTTSRRLSTGNISTVKATDIEKQPVNNPLYALQGRVPGLVITPTSGIAGSGVSVQIRGRNSLSFQTEPLIVVDGLPVPNNIKALGHPGFVDPQYQGRGMSALSFINPTDIESIDVLKDADATSIYGSRGANGVILITTKKGKAGRTRVSATVQSGWSKVAEKMKMMGTADFLDIRKEAFANSGIDFVNTFPYGMPPVYRDLYAPDLFVWDQQREVDWQDVLLNGTSKYTDANATVSGGTQTVQYTFGANYHKETTVFDNTNADKRANVHFSLTGMSANQRFKSTLSASFMNDNNTLPGTDFTRQAIMLAPNAPTLYDENGLLNWAMTPGLNMKTWDNPYAGLTRLYDANIDNLLASADVSYQLLPSLLLKTTVGFNQLKGTAFIASYPFAARPPEEMGNAAGSDHNRNGSKSIIAEPQLNYKNTFGKARLDVLVGATTQYMSTEDQSIGAYGFTSDALLKNLSAATTYYINNNSSQYRYAALFTRLNLSWDNKYLLNLSARRDASSRFGPGKEFGDFGSAAAAWIFSQEPFLQHAAPWLSFGKLRFSYGSSGNDGIGDYQYLERYEAVPSSDLYMGIRGYASRGLFNTDYAWESTRKMEVGLETGWLKDRIFVTASLYRNRSTNQLLRLNYPTMAGYGDPYINQPALIQNAGLELTLQADVIEGKAAKWSASLNYSRSRNKFIAFPGAPQSWKIGEPFYGTARIYKYAGVDPETGRYQFYEEDGSRTFTPSYLRTIMTEPYFFAGMSNSISWKGWSLDFFLQYIKQYGQSHLAEFIYDGPNRPGAEKNLPVEFNDRWKKPGDVAIMQKQYFIKPDEYNLSASFASASDMIYTDASFLRVKNLSLSYTIPSSWKEAMKIEQLRVFLQGQNVFTFTGYKGLDPETRTSRSLPPLRTITAGISITL